MTITRSSLKNAAQGYYPGCVFIEFINIIFKIIFFGVFHADILLFILIYTNKNKLMIFNANNTFFLKCFFFLNRLMCVTILIWRNNNDNGYVDSPRGNNLTLVIILIMEMVHLCPPWHLQGLIHHPAVKVCKYMYSCALLYMI